MSLYACIEEYRPEIEYTESNKYVVYGEVMTEQEEHIVSVALASSIQEPITKVELKINKLREK